MAFNLIGMVYQWENSCVRGVQPVVSKFTTSFLHAFRQDAQMNYN